MKAINVEVGGGVFHLGPDVAVDGLAAVLDASSSRPHGLHRRLHRWVRLKHEKESIKSVIRLRLKP